MTTDYFILFLFFHLILNPSEALILNPSPKDANPFPAGPTCPVKCAAISTGMESRNYEKLYIYLSRGIKKLWDTFSIFHGDSIGVQSRFFEMLLAYLSRGIKLR